MPSLHIERFLDPLDVTPVQGQPFSSKEWEMIMSACLHMLSQQRIDVIKTHDAELRSRSAARVKVWEQLCQKIQNEVEA